MKRILILRDASNRRRRYLVEALAARWCAAGHAVEERFTPRGLPDADVVFLHVDRTVVPDEYLDCLRDYPVVINRRARDIAKRRLSMNLVGVDDAYAGPVVVKTNANCGGFPESPLAGRLGELLGVPRNWGKAAVLSSDRYPVFASVADVPPAVWSNEALVVEKFLPEVTEGLYYLRYWIFFGDKGWAGRFGSRDPIVKWGNMATRDEPVTVPETLKPWRERLGIDYGRFDYVERDGQAILLDANKTIGAGHRMDEFKERLDDLATGIEDFQSP